jgi:hypothetical protein
VQKAVHFHRIYEPDHRRDMLHTDLPFKCFNICRRIRVLTRRVSEGNLPVLIWRRESRSLTCLKLVKQERIIHQHRRAVGVDNFDFLQGDNLRRWNCCFFFSPVPEWLAKIDSRFCPLVVVDLVICGNLDCKLIDYLLYIKTRGIRTFAGHS